jgi:hypothetical protein
MRQKLLLSLAGVACALMANGAAVSASASEDDKTEPKTFERRVVVRADGHGEPKVFVWSGKDGDVPPPDADHLIFAGKDGELMEFGRGFLGIQLIEMTPELRRHFGADEKSGVLVGQVEKDSPAAKAGLEVGDIIASVDGEPVAWSGEVGARVRKKKQGEMARVEIVRDGRGQPLNVEVAEREPMRAMLRKIDVGGLPGMEAHLGPLGPAMERALLAVDDPAVQDRIRERVEFKTARTVELEARLKALETRLKELEKELEEKNRR